MTMLLMTTLMTRLALLVLGHVRVVEMSVTAAGPVRVVEMSVTAATSRTQAAVGTAASELLLTGNNNVDGSTRFLYS